MFDVALIGAATTVVSGLIVTTAFTLMGRAHARQVMTLLAEHAAERRWLMNHAVAKSPVDFSVLQRATTSKSDAEPAAPRVSQIDL